MVVDHKTELLDKLQLFLLEDFVRLYEEERLSPTDRRTILQLLKEGGRGYHEDQLPKGLLAAIAQKYTLPPAPQPEDEDPI